MSRAVMQQALEALEAMQSYAAAERKGLRICDEAITALKQVLAESEQTPKGWIDEMAEVPEHLWKEWSEGYTAPTPRKPLSEDEIVRLMVGEDRAKLLSAGEFAEGAVRELVEYARAIEKAHGIGEQA